MLPVVFIRSGSMLRSYILRQQNGVWYGISVKRQTARKRKTKPSVSFTWSIRSDRQFPSTRTLPIFPDFCSSGVWVCALDHGRRQKNTIITFIFQSRFCDGSMCIFWLFSASILSYHASYFSDKLSLTQLHNLIIQTQTHSSTSASSWQCPNTISEILSHPPRCRYWRSSTSSSDSSPYPIAAATSLLGAVVKISITVHLEIFLFPDLPILLRLFP